jgi:hypothetical protein
MLSLLPLAFLLLPLSLFHPDPIVILIYSLTIDYIVFVEGVCSETRLSFEKDDSCHPTDFLSLITVRTKGSLSLICPAVGAKRKRE